MTFVDFCYSLNDYCVYFRFIYSSISVNRLLRLAEGIVTANSSAQLNQSVQRSAGVVNRKVGHGAYCIVSTAFVHSYPYPTRTCPFSSKNLPRDSKRSEQTSSA